MKQTTLIPLILVALILGICLVISCNGSGDGNGTPAECNDGIDNDLDGWVDSDDPDCGAGSPESGLGINQCNDGIDNDADGDTDSDDPDCTDALDDDESNCDDGLDNDSDGWSDGMDPECIAGQSETDFGVTQCNDGIDNDADGDIDSDDPGCLDGLDDIEADPVQRTAFYTSAQGTADLSSWPEVSGSGLTGPDAADAICQARADAAGLSGNYAAWISDDNDDAYCRAHGLTGKKADNCGQAELPATAGPWFRTDGTPFTDRIDLLTDSVVIYSPVRNDEFGSYFDVAYYYWTATNQSGVLYRDNCSNWTDSTSSGGLSIDMGSTASTRVLWTMYNVASSCDQDNSLLCFEVGINNILPDPQAEGKIVFVSSISVFPDLGSSPLAAGNTGIDAGDAICQNLAATAGLANAGSFKVWLSDSSTDARDRLNSDGPWVRPDGMMVAESTSALLNSWLGTSITLSEKGDYIGYYVMTGTLEDGTRSTENCSDWASSSAAVDLVRGHGSTIRAGYWTEAYSVNCSIPHQLYCFEN